MKRRDLLRATGALMLGAPAIRAVAQTCSTQGCTTPTPQDLLVTLNGPFAFWQDGKNIKVIAPPVGPDFPEAPHLPWIGTSTNQTPINAPAGTTFTLGINGYIPPDQPCCSGNTCFSYEQGTGTGTTPLFNLIVPNPNLIIGVRPTVAKMKCAPGVTDPYCTEFAMYCSSWTLLYKNVGLSGIVVNGTGPNFPFTPCFTNDMGLCEATLEVHLTPLDRHPDPEHRRAKAVWGRMLSMFPWMQAEITGIDFCSNFNPALCTFDPSTCPMPKPNRKPGHHGPLMWGPGSDCESPNCYMGGPGLKPKKYKKG